MTSCSNCRNLALNTTKASGERLLIIALVSMPSRRLCISSISSYTCSRLYCENAVFSIVWRDMCTCTVSIKIRASFISSRTSSDCFCFFMIAIWCRTLLLKKIFVKIFHTLDGYLQADRVGSNLGVPRLDFLREHQHAIFSQVRYHHFDVIVHIKGSDSLKQSEPKTQKSPKGDFCLAP